MNAEEFLEHYGVKGMKWGVRKSDRAARKQARADRREVNRLANKVGFLGDASVIDSFNDAANVMNNTRQPAINKKYEGKPIRADVATRIAYERESINAFHEEFNKAMAARGANVSSSGRFEANFDLDTGDVVVTARVEEIKQSSLAHEHELRFKVTRNSDGLITKYDMIPPQMEHSMDAAYFIEHRMGAKLDDMKT